MIRALTVVMHKASKKILSVAVLTLSFTVLTFIISPPSLPETFKLILSTLRGFEFNRFCNSLIIYDLSAPLSKNISTFLQQPYSMETMLAQAVCNKYYLHYLQR